MPLNTDGSLRDLDTFAVVLPRGIDGPETCVGFQCLSRNEWIIAAVTEELIASF